jgi:ABC-type Fe3+ transport system permease subunit
VQIFWRVTLPNIKWGLLYGVILCNARAMGEFGAVYLVSAGFSDQITLPLRVERVYTATLVSIAPAFAWPPCSAAMPTTDPRVHMSRSRAAARGGSARTRRASRASTGGSGR